MMQDLVDEPAACLDRHAERPLDQGGGHVCVHGPAKDAACKEVNDHGQVEPALRRGHIGEIGQPNLVRGAHPELLLQVVGRHRMGLVALRGAPVGLTSLGLEMRLLHEPDDPFAAAADALLTQLLVNLGASVDATARRMDLRNASLQRLVRGLASAWPTSAPGIVAALGHMYSKGSCLTDRVYARRRTITN